jgi:Flp pilus assembly protein TadG
MFKRGQLHEERGQAVTEFAVVLPILATILLAIIQCGIVLNHYLTLNDAVRVAARTAAANADLGGGSATSAAQQALTNASDGLTLRNVSITSSWESGTPVTVSAETPYTVTLLGVTVASGTFKSSTVERAE